METRATIKLVEDLDAEHIKQALINKLTECDTFDKYVPLQAIAQEAADVELENETGYHKGTWAPWDEKGSMTFNGQNGKIREIHKVCKNKGCTEKARIKFCSNRCKDQYHNWKNPRGLMGPLRKK